MKFDTIRPARNRFVRAVAARRFFGFLSRRRKRALNSVARMNSLLMTISSRDLTEAAQTHRCLEKGEVLRLKRVRVRSLIRCRTGRLWITQTGLASDIVLASGQLFESDREGSLVIEALEPACFTHEEPITPERHE